MHELTKIGQLKTGMLPDLMSLDFCHEMLAPSCFVPVVQAAGGGRNIFANQPPDETGKFVRDGLP